MTEETMMTLLRGGAAVIGGWILWLLVTTFKGKNQPAQESPPPASEPGGPAR